MSKLSLKRTLLVLLCLFGATTARAQVSTCDSLVPSFTVDLSDDPSGVFYSEDIRREGLCCDNYWPDRCVEFFITLHPSALGLIFDIERGAEPPGALFYRIGCGPEIPVGELACLDGPGPHILTFCKPGANRNIYSITSVPGRLIPDTATVVEGCSVELGVDGLIPSTVTWTDITSGTEAYNDLLDCPVGCDTVMFNSEHGLPDFVSYRVCGILSNPICNQDTAACDTVTVRILRDLEVSIQPGSDTICTETPQRELEALVTGSYDSLVLSWYFHGVGGPVLVGTGNDLTVTASGTYSVVAYDAMHRDCRRDTATVTIRFAPFPDLHLPGSGDVCAGEEITINASGAAVYNWYNASGALCLDCPSLTYTPTTSETIYVQGISEYGCETWDSLYITVHPVPVTTIYASFCSGQTYTLPNGQEVDQEGAYTHVLTTQAGCDSIVHTVLYELPSYIITASAAICEGETYMLPGGGEVTEPGNYADYFTTVDGCDSIHITLLTVHPSYDIAVNALVCEPGSYTLPGGNVVYSSGTYVDSFQTVRGCDSVITTHLTVAPIFEISLADTICQGDQYTLPDASQTGAAGNYTFTYQTASGCDSVVTVALTVMPSYQIPVSVTLCSGELHTLPDGTVADQSGTYTHAFTTAFGCDSVITTTLTYLPEYSDTVYAEICEGQSHQLPGGDEVQQSGFYIDSLLTSAGCDSVIATWLTVHPVYDTQVQESVCFGDSHTLPDGSEVTAAGVYPVTLQTIHGCDSVVTTELEVNPTFDIIRTDTICAGELYVFPNGDTAQASGTFVHAFTTASGCDSVYTTHLTVLPVWEDTLNITRCDGESYTLPSGAVVTTSGWYTEFLQTAAGCDSTLHFSVEFRPNYAVTDSHTICSGESHTLPDGSVVTASGTWVHTLTSQSGCDSVVITHLTVLPVWNFAISDTICEVETYYLPDGSVADSSGTYTYTFNTPTACDSSVTVQLTVLPVVVTTVYDTICAGDIYVFPGGQVATEPGVSVDTFFTGFGCDSVIQTVLTVLPAYDIAQQADICAGEIYVLPDGTPVTATGVYTTSFSTSGGCDSVITTALTVRQPYFATVTDTICSVETYTLPGGDIVNLSGTYVDSFYTAFGCDSVITTELIVMPTVIREVHDTICAGDTYVFPNGETAVADGAFTDTLYTGFGCDSVIHIYLTVLPSYAISIADTLCAGELYTLPDGSVTYAAGEYVHAFSTTAGCDSVITTTLTVINPFAVTVNAAICQGETYTLPDGLAVTNAGTYVSAFTGAAGCDSTITTVLEVHPVYETTLTEALCDGEAYQLPGGQQVTAAGFYTDTLVTVNGCDSIVHVDLSYLPVYDILVADTICEGDSYVLPDGSTTSAGGTFTHAFTTVSGCDSIIVTQLYMAPAYEETISVMLCAGEEYTLPDGSIVSTAGTYVIAFTTALGCDSTIITELQYAQPFFDAVAVAICSGESYVLPGGDEVAAPGVYVDSFTTWAGCDSIIETTIQVNPGYSDTIRAAVCAGEEYVLPDGSTTVEPGSYSIPYTTSAGCDSVIVVELDVWPTYYAEQAVDICEGNSFVLPGGSTVNESGTYVDSFLTAMGCDSIFTTHLVVHKNYLVNEAASVCEGETFQLPGGLLVSEAGVYLDSLTSSAGCDSVVITRLSLVPMRAVENQIEICEKEPFILPTGQIVYEAGVYVDSFITAEGCDFVITTDLAVHPVYELERFDTICGGEIYTLPDGQTVTQAGVYTNAFVTDETCDSTIVTRLTVLPSYDLVYRDTICGGESYELPGGQVVTTGGAYTEVFTTYMGCDSVITVELTVMDSWDLSNPVGICPGESYTLPGGDKVNTPGTYVDSFSTAYGCDSVITTVVTELPVYDIHLTYPVCEGDFVTLPDSVAYDNDTTVSMLYTSAVGCDSLVTHHVEIIRTTTTFADVIICEGDFLLVGETAYYEPAFFTDTLASAFGCDSIVVVDLSVRQPFQARIDTSMCPGDEVYLAGQWFTEQGEYTVRYEDAYGCDSTYFVRIVYHDVPVVKARQDTTIYQGEEVEAYTLYYSDRPLQFAWYINDSLVHRDVTRFREQYFRSAEVRVEIIDTNLCSSSDVFRIEINEVCPDDLIFAPNIISPNHDGANDVFDILNPSQVIISEVAIFNRWGELVYSASDFTQPWDGTFRGMACQPDVYTYYIKGTCTSGGRLLKKGNITLIR